MGHFACARGVGPLRSATGDEPNDRLTGHGMVEHAGVHHRSRSRAIRPAGHGDRLGSPIRRHPTCSGFINEYRHAA